MAVAKRETGKYGGKRELTALDYFDAMMSFVDRHRPYGPDDFVEEYFIPDI